MDLLKTQLLLKNVLTEEDWLTNRERVRFEFATDAYYEETKEQEMLRSRLEILLEANNFVGVYYSKSWVMKNILRMSKEEREQMEEEMDEEVSTGAVVPQVQDVMSSADMPPETNPTKSKPKKSK